MAFIDMPYRLAGEQPEHFAQYLVQAIARGANPSTYIMGTPGDIPYGALDAAAAITRFRDRWAEVYRDLLPVATIGLVRPDPLAGPAERRAESLAEFRGIYEALQQTHLPFDVVPQAGLVEMAGNGGLDRYPVLVLPDLSLAADAPGCSTPRSRAGATCCSPVRAGSTPRAARRSGVPRRSGSPRP
ncbi:hypothetical protein BJF90_24185 [Pseudonocardia sp. CNS-004]|nr:hypothetical protein BJF90_24185 [Pseudonocardia sp. CNS-004]